ncbi:MAG: Lysophospholipase L1/Azurin [Verrucomicrobia bacterium]|nr:MAG: Lysophospholipase L1/Azurin [Verrucomicrobiota bacterium]
MTLPRIPQLLGGLTALILCAERAGAADFSFQTDDHVVVVGNGLGERFVFDGWFETLLQAAQPDKKLVVRNLSFPGDQVAKRPRSQGYPKVEDQLKHCGADVILVFFGFNESFAGEQGLEPFQKDLTAMIDAYRALKPNGESEPRLVLFSPIAHEDLGTPNLPDGKANNARLALYTTAIREVAAAKGLKFVDLFAATQALYAAQSAPLTINGVHLNEEGNRLLAEVIAEALGGAPVSSKGRESLRQAVLDKDWHWFNRYRATDGNDIWGGRSTLKFVNDQSNAEVLQHELTMLDVMTANRDPLIWARAAGSDFKVDDSKVPPPVPVISNVGGGSKSSSAEKEGTLQYLSGQDGIAKLTVPPGFKVNLFADESMFPELVNPVQMAVDPKGRLWVASWGTYPMWEPLKKMSDKLLILPDENHDGVADKAITFAEVHNPSALEFWNGGVLVVSQPNLLFLKDTDGDDVADVRYVILSGLGTEDTHHGANNFVYGPDGGIYWQSGVFLVNNFEHPWGPSLESKSAGMFRFDPRRSTISFHAANSPNSHGTAFDGWGYHYATDGTSGNAFQVRPEGRGFKMHELLRKEVRPVPSCGVISSANFPDDYQQDFIICNTIGFLGIKRYDLDRDGATVSTQVRRKNSATGKDENVPVTKEYRFGEVWGSPMGDLISSSDKNFRPTDSEFGEDGALYIADWQNVIIGHMQHNVRDPNRDKKHGRVYRMVNTQKPLQERVEIADQPIPVLLDLLKHPIDGVRYRTRIELSGRNTDEVLTAAATWIKQFDATKAADAHPLLEALWLHQQHNRKNTQLLAALLKSPEPNARKAAETVQHFWFNVDFTGGGETGPQLEIAAKKPSGVLSATDKLVKVQVGTVLEQLRYDLKEFSVKAGVDVELNFTNNDFVPHNLLVVQPKSGDEVAMAAIAMGADGFAAGFRPKSDKILAASALLDHGKEETLQFKAPMTPGAYEFICTFPGHHILMRGLMNVVQ